MRAQIDFFQTRAVGNRCNCQKVARPSSVILLLVNHAWIGGGDFYIASEIAPCLLTFPSLPFLKLNIWRNMYGK